MPDWEKHAILCSFSRLIEGQTGAEEHLEIFLTLINILKKGTPLTLLELIYQKKGQVSKLYLFLRRKNVKYYILL